MSKYDQLWEYIKTNAPVELSFDEVQQICGFPIDHSFLNCKKELKANGMATLEVYSAGDPQSSDYESGIWVPVKEA